MKSKDSPGSKSLASKSTEVAPLTLTAEHTAKLLNLPTLNAAAVVAAYAKQPFEKFGDLDIQAAMRELGDKAKEVHSGDLERVEAMLLTQAHALQSMFTHLSRRALSQGLQSHFEAFFRMSMKAQNQCRMTLETLATIKQGPAIFAKQANVNNGGQQQINNGTAPPQSEGVSKPARAAETVDAAPACKSQKQQNELLEDQRGQWLDTGAACAPGRADPQMETVGEVHRSAKRGRKGAVGPERVQGRNLA